MNDLFVDYNIALELKEIGFDEPCLCYFIETKERIFSTIYTEHDILPSNSDLILNWVSCPLKYQVFKWFREVHNMYGEIYILCGEWRIQIACLNKEDLGSYYTGYTDLEYNTYEEAELKVIKQMINIVKNDK